MNNTMRELYHVATADGTKCGQMAKEDILTRLKEGTLPQDALVWRVGMPDWQPVGTIQRNAPTNASWDIRAALKSSYRKRRICIRGRACRAEYWYTHLAYWSILAIIAVLMSVLNSSILAFAFVIFMIFSVAPLICLQVRRLHDIGLSGCWCILCIIPILGTIFLFVCSLIPSGAPNRWGEKSDEPV